MRLLRFRVRTFMLAVAVVALLIWGAMIGTRWFVYYSLATRYGTYERQMREVAARDRGNPDEHAEHRGGMGSADCRLLRDDGPEASPSECGSLDTRRPRSSHIRGWVRTTVFAQVPCRLVDRISRIRTLPRGQGRPGPKGRQPWPRNFPQVIPMALEHELAVYKEHLLELLPSEG